MIEGVSSAERNTEDTSVENARLSMVLNDQPGAGEDGGEISSWLYL